MSHSSTRIDTFLLGYCDDTRALLAHLDAEAPWRVSTVRVLDPDPLIVRTLSVNGLKAGAVDLWDDAALRAEGLEGATTVVVFAERVRGSIDRFERVIRGVSPTAQFLVVPRGAGAAPPSLPAPSTPALRVVTSWRFWALVGLTILDGLIFMVPVTGLLLLIGALLNPRWLRATARFFDQLAGAR